MFFVESIKAFKDIYIRYLKKILMPAYRNVPLRAITESAVNEAAELGMNLDDIANLLEESYECSDSKRKEGIEERCVRKRHRVLKIVIELRTSRSGFEYWRIRQIGFVR